MKMNPLGSRKDAGKRRLFVLVSCFTMREKLAEERFEIPPKPSPPKGSRENHTEKDLENDAAGTGIHIPVCILTRDENAEHHQRGIACSPLYLLGGHTLGYPLPIIHGQAPKLILHRGNSKH